MKGTASSDAWRVFVAIELPEAIRERLMLHAGRLREQVPQSQASWTRPENIHLTLKFLKEVPQHRTDQLSAAASRAVVTIGAFRIGVGGTGAFPTHGAPRVLWIGLTNSDGKLSEVHARLEAECARVGFQKETRSFHPHLTLARLHHPATAKALAAAHKHTPFDPEEFTLSELLVIRSELSSPGSKYTVLSRHPLGGS